MTDMRARRRLAALVLALVLAGGARAWATFWDFEQIPVDATSGGVKFTVSKITPANQPPMTYADCALRTAEISYLYVDPAKVTVTSTVGQLLEPGSHLYIYKREDLLNFRAVRTTSTSGQLDCTYKDQP